MERLSKSVITIVIVIIVGLIILANTVVTIGSGEAGVLFKPLGDGVVTNEPPMGEGFHIVAPWNSVYIYNVRQQAIDEKMVVLSSNGLDIKLDATIWFQPKYDQLGLLHQKRGEDYLDLLIKPAVRSATRSVVGRYKPEELYAQKRESIQNEMFQETKSLLENQFVQVNEILVRDVSLPQTIKDAIERKLKQEQESLEYEFRIEKAQKEKERQRIEAEGKAQANEILNSTLTDKVLKEKGIQATIELSKSENAKVIVIGSGQEGMPIILGNN